MQETRALLESSKYFYIIISDMNGNYSYVNQHYADEFAYIHENFVGEPYYITMHEDDRKTCEEVSLKCFANPGQLFPAVIRKHDGKGGYLYTQWEYQAMFDEENMPQGIFCLGYNITQFVADRQNLEGAIDKIEKTATLLTQISFQQSHLIRAPLTNILSLSAILEKRSDDEQLRKICLMIMESATKLDLTVREIVENIGHNQAES
ncbi:PAS domain-containing protein [Pedobacter rhodius]|uniref:PAS domain-containing protein n=1 Tax=Pedobacter rhodius TaxID=3004098 RepID=A0ABT4L4E4_9SPHI|nr:PAS domain-containing protein [Pedobacter sp. SJ11]MCZ4224923.1 PAS domain-containing protein [Pedobacter sp. SJ11]